MQAVASTSVVSIRELGIASMGMGVPASIAITQPTSQPTSQPTAQVSADGMQRSDPHGDLQCMPSMQSRMAAACVGHALRDYIGQGLGRTAGLLLYCGLASYDELGLRISAGVAGAAIGGRMAWRLPPRPADRTTSSESSETVA